MCRDRRHLRLFLAGFDWAGHRPQGFDRALCGAVQAALEVNRTGASDDIAEAVSENRVRQNCRCARAVANTVAGLLSGLPQHLRAEVLLRVLEVKFLGDGLTVVAYERRPPLLLDEHRLGFWAQCDAHSVTKQSGAVQDFLASRRTEQHLFVSHADVLLLRSA